MAGESVTAPQSSTGIIRFSDTDTGGPHLDPRSVFAFTIIFILLVEIIGHLVGQ